MASSSKIHFYFPYRRNEKDKYLALDSLDREKVFLEIGENETVLVSKEGDDTRYRVSLKLDNYYEVDAPLLKKIKKGEDVEFTPLKETENGELVLDEGHLYAILNGGDNNVGLIPGTYFLYVMDLRSLKKVKIPFSVIYLKNVDSYSIDLLRKELEKFSQALTVSERKDLFDNGKEVATDHKDYSLDENDRVLFLEKLSLLNQTMIYSLRPSIVQGRVMKRQSPATIRKNDKKIDEGLSFNAKKILSYDIPINQMLKHYLLLLKNTFFALSKKAKGKAGEDHRRCYLAVVKTLNDSFPNVSNSNGMVLSESFFIHPLYSFFFHFYAKLACIEKNGNDTKESLRYKDSSEIFELGGIIFLKKILLDLGLGLTNSLLPSGENIDDYGLFVFENDMDRVKVYYDYHCEDSLSSQKDRMVSINSHNDRPDYLLLFYDKATSKLKNVVALEMKYRRFDFAGSLSSRRSERRMEKLRLTLNDYVQLAYKDGDEAIERGVVSTVYVLFPGKDHPPVTDFSFASKLYGIDIGLFLEGKGIVYGSLKEDLGKLIG